MKQISKRFEELAKQAAEIESSKVMKQSAIGNKFNINGHALLNWTVKVRNLLAMAAGEDSQHFVRFAASEKPNSYTNSYDIFLRVRAVFLAAKEDYEGGYMTSVKTLIQAEVFDNELEQAEELLGAGYKVSAAVIAGTVLETTLRDMCNDLGIATGKLDKMNADLAKVGAYNKLRQKEITALADIRNNAAHGHPDQFADRDVADMIRDVRKFLADRAP
jgi:hypothetical protein